MAMYFECRINKTIGDFAHWNMSKVDALLVNIIDFSTFSLAYIRILSEIDNLVKSQLLHWSVSAPELLLVVIYITT